jgi:YesN/AraC family two-component response regulator
LILCKEFAEKHGGTITAKRNIEKGACFLFTLPNSKPVIANEQTGVANHASKQYVTPDDWHDESVASLPLVLIAEDDDDIRWYIKQTLISDFQITEAVNGNDAALMAFEKMPDVIISDMNMPGLNGVDLCIRIKDHHQTSHIPFIMLTAEKGSDKKVSGFEHGADDYITKPVEPAVLRARIHNILETRRKLKTIYQKDITSEPETFTTNTVDQEFMEKLNNIIETRMADSDLNPDSLAQDMNMSRTGLYMKVKALTGESVSIYVRNVRLKESRKLLKSRKMNVSEVAYAVGFNQLPYFTSCFKEAFGITPTEFINGQKV